MQKWVSEPKLVNGSRRIFQEVSKTTGRPCAISSCLLASPSAEKRSSLILVSALRLFSRCCVLSCMADSADINTSVSFSFSLYLWSSCQKEKVDRRTDKEDKVNIICSQHLFKCVWPAGSLSRAINKHQLEELEEVDNLTWTFNSSSLICSSLSLMSIVSFLHSASNSVMRRRSVSVHSPLRK